MAALAVAVIMAVIDTTRSVAASDIVMTPLVQSWQAVSPETLDQAQVVFGHYGLALLWDPVIAWILSLPGFAVFAALAFVFYAAGRKPERAHGLLTG